MLAKVKSFSLSGIQGYPVDVEVDINNGLPSFETVGLAQTAVKESRERVRSGIKTAAFVSGVQNHCQSGARRHQKNGAYF